MAASWVATSGASAITSTDCATAPNSSATAMATHGQRAGTASALMGALQFGLATLAGTVMGLGHGASPAPLAAIMSACALAGWWVHRTLIHPAGK
ncbi:MAG: multidrug effflux MFS transporter [Thiobacillus sp.]|nr:multidrug effflux MFS transporter [Thiobacillus sp.]